MTAKKLNFKNSPAEQFITATTERRAQETPAAPLPEIRELRNRRLNLSLQPSVVEDAQKLAFMHHQTLNAFVNELLKQYAQEHADEIETYDTLFKGKENKE